jgi:quinol monooxygenase YgiN
MVERIADGTTVAADPTVMVLASLTSRVQSFKRAEALSSVDALVQRMRGTSGCLRSRVLIDTDDVNSFMVVSEWIDPATAEAFVASCDFRVFRGIRILLRDQPVIVLDDIRTRTTRLLSSDSASPSV